MTHYRRMSPAQAEAALDEFLTERVPALRRLRAELTAAGLDPEVLLDGIPESLTRLWEWIVDRRAELAADPAITDAVEPRERWPSWARHTVTSLHVPTATMFVLLDGLVSYLAQVLILGALERVLGPGVPCRCGSSSAPAPGADRGWAADFRAHLADGWDAAPQTRATHPGRE